MTKIYAPGSAANTGHIVPFGNMEMYYEVYGSGQPLLLLHGYGGCIKNWYPFIDALSPHYRLIIADLRGHGRTTNPANTFTHREAAKDVFHLLEHLGIAACAAMGMSTGGMVLLHMATQQPSRFSAMVLISTTTHFPEQARTIMRRASFDTLPAEVRAMYGACAARGDVQIRQLITQFNALAENRDDMNFTKVQLSGIQSPTLIIHGENDQFFPSAIAEQMHQSIRGSKLWLIPRGEHVPVFDPAVPFTDTALRFLAESHH